MDPKQFDAMLSDAEIRLRRLKTLYDQWFMGIERMEPAAPKKELEDLLAKLKREHVKNTAARFRLQQMVQRHVTYTTYWRRISRQIEEGTFKRDLIRARRQKKRDSSDDDADLNYEIDVELDVDMDMDMDAALAEAEEASTRLAHAPAKPAPGVPAAAVPPVAAAPRLVMPGGPKIAAPPAVGVAPGKPAPPVPAGKPVPPSAAAALAALAASLAPPKGAPPGAAAPIALPLTAAGGGAAAGASPTAAKAPRPPAAGSKQAAAAATTVAQAAKPKPPGVPAKAPASAGHDNNGARPALSSEDVQRIYSNYVAARKQNAERTDNVKFDNIEKTLRGMLPSLEKKHAGKKIDFEVVVKDGKVALKPVAK